MIIARYFIVALLALLMPIAPVSAACCNTYYYSNCCSPCEPCCEVEYVEVIDCGCSTGCDTCKSTTETAASSCAGCGESLPEQNQNIKSEPSLLQEKPQPELATNETEMSEINQQSLPVPVVSNPTAPPSVPAIESTADPVAPEESVMPGPAEEPMEDQPLIEEQEETSEITEQDPIDLGPEEESTESLFDESEDFDLSDDEMPIEEEAPAEENQDAPAEEEESSDFEDLFGMQETMEILSKKGGIESSISRNWTDNTGRYHCKARIVKISPEAIVLKIDSGAKKAVSFKRLSDSDLRFVKQQVQAKQKLVAYLATNEKLATK